MKNFTEDQKLEIEKIIKAFLLEEVNKKTWLMNMFKILERDPDRLMGNVCGPSAIKINPATGERCLVYGYWGDDDD